jgi:hypothetical protein
MEFPESIPNFFQTCREVGILMEGEVGDIPGSVKDSTKDFGLEGLAEPHSSMPYAQVGFRIVLYIVSLLLRSTVDDLCNSLRRSP